MTDSTTNSLYRAIEGDESALVELLQEHGPRLRTMLQHRIPSRWQSVLSVDDALQETYAEAFLHIRRLEYRGTAAFAKWLSTLATRNLRDALKGLAAEKRGGSRTFHELGTQGDSVITLFELVTSRSDSPSRQVALQEASTALKDAMAKLPITYRQVVQLYDLDGLSVDTVAKGIGRTAGAVFMIRARAHDRLAELMGDASRYLSDPGGSESRDSSK